MKKFTELTKSLLIGGACLLLVLLSYALLPGYAGAIPGGLQTLCTVFVVALGLAILYRIFNDGLDAWPTVVIFILTIAIVGIQLGYKAEAKANPFPSQPTAYVPECF